MKFTTLIEVTQYFSSEQNCTDYLTKLRWKNGVICPFCEHDKAYYLSKYKRYKCADCKKQFSAIKGTIFENSPIALQKWFIAIYLISSQKRGISSYQLAKHIGVTQGTAWFMSQRIRHIFKTKSLKRMNNVMVDETFVGGKNKNRHWDKKVKNSQGRSFKDKTPVLGILQENGNLYTLVITDTKATTIQPIINRMVKRGGTITTDEWKAYSNLEERYTHYIVDHSKGQHSTEQGFTTNPVECAWSHFKRMIIGTYYKASRKHLQRYCDEFTFRYNSRNIADNQRFNLSLGAVKCRLTYKQLIGKQ